MKENTQFPQLTVDGGGEDDVEVVGEEPSLQTADSSPKEAKVYLFWINTAALFDIPSTPVGVPVSGRITSGLE